MRVHEAAQARREPLERGPDARRHLAGELRDVGERGRPERSEGAPHQMVDRGVLRRPRAAGDPVLRRDVRRVGAAVVPAPSGRGGHQIRVRADEPPHQPGVLLIEDFAEPLAQMRDHVFLRARRTGERHREARDPLRLDPVRHLEPVPRAALQILGRDCIRVEIAGAHQMQRPAHEPRADDGVSLDRRPEPLALEAVKTRPERDVRRGRPLRLQRGEPPDGGDDVERCPLEEHLAREGRAVELAEAEDRRVDRTRHARTPWVGASG